MKNDAWKVVAEAGLKWVVELEITDDVKERSRLTNAKTAMLDASARREGSFAILRTKRVVIGQKREKKRRYGKGI